MGGAGDSPICDGGRAVSRLPCASRSALSPLGSFAFACSSPIPLISGVMRFAPPCLSAVVSPCVAAYRLIAIYRLRSELVKTAHFAIASPPRSPSRHAVIPIVRPCSHLSVLTAHRYSPRLVPAFCPSLRPHLTPRLPAPLAVSRDGAEAIAWRVRVIWVHAVLYAWHSCYISRIFVISRAFLLYRSHSCYISCALVISICFVLYYFVGIMRLWAGVFN